MKYSCYARFHNLIFTMCPSPIFGEEVRYRKTPIHFSWSLFRSDYKTFKFNQKLRLYCKTRVIVARFEKNPYLGKMSLPYFHQSLFWKKVFKALVEDKVARSICIPDQKNEPLNFRLIHNFMQQMIFLVWNKIISQTIHV